MRHKPGSLVWWETKKHVFWWSKPGRWLRGRVTTVGLWFLRRARQCLSWSYQRCWVCGKEPGMSGVAGKRLWCDECYARYEEHRTPPLVCDWKGLGRLPRKRP